VKGTCFSYCPQSFMFENLYVDVMRGARRGRELGERERERESERERERCLVSF
jgi:hypothetical protein